MSFCIGRKNFLHSDGFTLIELIVVMALMALLAIVGLTNYQTSLQNGRDNRRKLDLKSLASSLQLYYSDYGRYLDAVDTTYHVLPSGAPPVGLSPSYIKVLPHDPKFAAGSNDDYQYMTYQAGQCYCLSARLERLVNNKNETGSPPACSPASSHTNYNVLFCP